ncbi:MAG: tetratricopeptide repeat protein [Myxococcus sp.]|nr:tetratricopeptide repeat protein [Myxococcus sp.]
MISTLLIASLLAAPAGGPAKGAATPPEATDLARAKELVQAGQRLYKQARYPEAIAKFEEAYLVRPHPVITYNIGKCYEQLGETARAMRAYRDYLRLSPNADDRETVSDAITNLERRLREKGLQQLMVFAEPPSARVSIDGKDLGNPPVSIELIAGTGGQRPRRDLDQLQDARRHATDGHPHGARPRRRERRRDDQHQRRVLRASAAEHRDPLPLA